MWVCESEVCMWVCESEVWECDMRCGGVCVECVGV